MRRPSTAAERWAWWESAVAGENPPIHEDEPHEGFFATRRFKYGQWVKGPFVPARLWWEPGPTDPETGELLSDEQLRGEIDGQRINPWRAWVYLAKRPITEDEWKWLRAQAPLLPTKIPPKQSPRR